MRLLKKIGISLFYCPYPLCNSKLFVCAGDGSRKAYFRATKSAYKHIANCPYANSSVVFDDNKFVFVAQKDGIGGIAFGQDIFRSWMSIKKRSIKVWLIERKMVHLKLQKMSILILFLMIWMRLAFQVKRRKYINY